MSKIKYSLVKFEKALAFQVLEMDERFRNFNNPISFGGGGDLCVLSTNFPDIISESERVYLRGNIQKKDFTVSVDYFADNIRRDEMANRIHKAIKNWAENWPGFKDDPKPEKQTDENAAKVIEA